ncbi:MAG: ComF family protein [Puniceicoccales bacterium]|jgi:ComF family protein|nr:ComF family protein [Puniceicoccales bacterium]
MSGKSIFRDAGRHFLDFLFPRTCLGCGSALGKKSTYCYICPDCLREIEWIHNHFCPRCGAPDVENGDVCDECEKKTFSFRRNRSLYVYSGLGRQVIHELKYRNGRHLLPDIGRMANEARLDLGNTVLVPVPLHWWRRWLRGFNQSELICGHLAKIYGCKVCPLLCRNRHTRRQFGLGARARWRNVGNAFQVNERVRAKMKIAKNFKITLVDDIFTTGATMEACAKVLVAAGFGHVEALTLARA